MNKSIMPNGMCLPFGMNTNYFHLTLPIRACQLRSFGDCGKVILKKIFQRKLSGQI